MAEQGCCACAHLHNASRPPTAAAGMLPSMPIPSPDRAGHNPARDLNHALTWGGQDLTADLLSPWPFPCCVPYCDATTTRVIRGHAFMHIAYMCILAHTIP